MSLLGNHNINYTFFDDVRVPATNLVGGENNGWTLITNQLNHERVTLCSPGIVVIAMGAPQRMNARTWSRRESRDTR
jgi:alkylation response protein AidB-like acyl-CoA dehydrogenase